jgi:hypothetical protein
MIYLITGASRYAGTDVRSEIPFSSLHRKLSNISLESSGGGNGLRVAAAANRKPDYRLILDGHRS